MKASDFETKVAVSFVGPDRFRIVPSTACSMNHKVTLLALLHNASMCRFVCVCQ